MSIKTPLLKTPSGGVTNTSVTIVVLSLTHQTEFPFTGNLDVSKPVTEHFYAVNYPLKGGGGL